MHRWASLNVGPSLPSSPDPRLLPSSNWAISSSCSVYHFISHHHESQKGGPGGTPARSHFHPPLECPSLSLEEVLIAHPWAVVG